MQNAAFRYLNINAIYTSFDVRPATLAAAVKAIKYAGICGVNVTIPYKEAVIRHLDHLAQEARLIGAVNTIVNKNGKLVGYNTDVYGFIRALKEGLKFNPRGKTIFILGAGGAAKAAGFGLAIAGAKRIVLTDIVDDKALELACEIEMKTECECIALKRNSPGVLEMILNSQLLVNATPCGMHAGDPISVRADFLHKGLCVLDLIYNRPTELVKAAKENGIKAAGGLNMLLYQGAKSFELWTGKRAPVKVMKKALNI
jgi:shikimate dehydrogenase